MLGVGGVEEVASSYAHPLIFFFLGGFLIATALQCWEQHRRIATNVLRLGPSFGLCDLR